MFVLFAFDTAGAYLASLYTEHRLHPPATEKQSEGYQIYPKTKIDSEAERQRRKRRIQMDRRHHEKGG